MGGRVQQNLIKQTKFEFEFYLRGFCWFSFYISKEDVFNKSFPVPHLVLILPLLLLLRILWSDLSWTIRLDLDTIETILSLYQTGAVILSPMTRATVNTWEKHIHQIIISLQSSGNSSALEFIIVWLFTVPHSGVYTRGPALSRVTCR